MERELFDVVFDSASLNSNINLVSSSLGFFEIIMELSGGSFSNEVLSYDLVCLCDHWMANFCERLEF